MKPKAKEILPVPALVHLHKYLMHQTRKEGVEDRGGMKRAGWGLCYNFKVCLTYQIHSEYMLNCISSIAVCVLVVYLFVSLSDLQVLSAVLL